MASRYQGRDFRSSFTIGGGSAIQFPYHPQSDVPADVVTGGALLKRSLTELERQQQIQHALLLRSVKQRTSFNFAAAGETTAALAAAAAAAPSPPASSGFSYLRPAQSTMHNRLQELERRLLDDDDDDDDDNDVSAAVSSVTEWGETMQQLISSPSPTTSSSSSSSSTASTSSPTPSRQLLLDAAAAVADGNAETAAAYLAVLKRAANPRGDADQRLTAIMVTALVSRTNPAAAAAAARPIADLCSAEHQAATQLLLDLSPCFKLGLLAANLAILEATRDSPKIHILDFDVGQGGQHAALLHALAERHRRSGGGRPPAVKITAVCINGTNNLNLVGDRIANLAARLGIALKFSIVSRPAVDLDESVLGCEPGEEALAVNLAFQLSRVADESVSPANPRDELLRRVRDLRPRVVALVEQELNANTAPFAARFAEACGHYGALLESLEATKGRESEERARMEACLARKAANSVAREGAERIERCEVFGKWRARMGMAGLRPVPVGPGVVEPVMARLALLRNNPGFTIREEAGGLCFGWMGRVLTVASVWR